ncbi:MAG TPA: methylenetetrahydrofolate reductase, partial [Candidatus Pelagibacter sp.]|nr:methylenetetrahydrofolate reductase [Candidatus Pelagibacter sp.]
MKFSLEIGPGTDLETLPSVKDVYITLLPGENYLETTKKAGDLFKKGFNPVPHFPARSILDEAQLNDYVSRCKDLGVKQALVIGGSRDPIGVFDSSIQLLETGYFEKMKIGIAGHPEGSPDISDSKLEKAMKDKKPYADYIV